MDLLAAEELAEQKWNCADAGEVEAGEDPKTMGLLNSESWEVAGAEQWWLEVPHVCGNCLEVVVWEMLVDCYVLAVVGVQQRACARLGKVEEHRISIEVLSRHPSAFWAASVEEVARGLQDLKMLAVLLAAPGLSYAQISLHLQWVEVL